MLIGKTSIESSTRGVALRSAVPASGTCADAHPLCPPLLFIVLQSRSLFCTRSRSSAPLSTAQHSPQQHPWPPRFPTSQRGPADLVRASDVHSARGTVLGCATTRASPRFLSVSAVHALPVAIIGDEVRTARHCTERWC